ncbi:sugar phosphate isomerase/epimerase family protein [Enterococcus sp. LJL99]
MIKLGVTLFCYGTEYARYEYDFEECVKQAALAGAKGYEIVGSQMLPTYPNVSNEFLGLIKTLTEKYDICPVGYGANNDKGLMHDRNLTDEEMLADTIIDLKTAHKLGCKVMRAQYMLSPKAFERLAVYAELYDVKVGIEIHNPESPLSPLMKQYLAVIKKTKSTHLGLIPDFGCFATAPNKAHWIKALEVGVAEEHLQLAAEMRYQGVPLTQARERLTSLNAHPAINQALQGMYGFVQFKPKEELPNLLAELKEILPYCIEFHGKFHYLSEELIEPSIPYKEILSVIKESDFDGYLICEYEDELYCGGTEFTKRQLKMVKNLLAIDETER